MKYYIVKRNDQNTDVNFLISDCPKLTKKDSKRIEKTKHLPFVLIEKDIRSICESEVITNIYFFEYNNITFEEIKKITKESLIYDCTGIVSPLIHYNGKLYTFDQYCEL